jgi:hypothetical protein
MEMYNNILSHCLGWPGMQWHCIPHYLFFIALLLVVFFCLFLKPWYIRTFPFLHATLSFVRVVRKCRKSSLPRYVISINSSELERDNDLDDCKIQRERERSVWIESSYNLTHNADFFSCCSTYLLFGRQCLAIVRHSSRLSCWPLCWRQLIVNGLMN